MAIMMVGGVVELASAATLALASTRKANGVGGGSRVGLED